jgi:hypothetical protein
MSPTTPDTSTPPADAATGFPSVEVSAGATPGAWTARVAMPGGQRLALHSARNPQAEAQLQLAAIDAAASAPSVIVLIGAGLGFTTEAAHQRWPGARIVVLEPSPELARHAQARTPGLYASGHVHLLAGPNYDGAGAGARPLWQLLITREGTDPPVLVHPVIARAAPRAAAIAEAVARRAMLAAQMNEKAREENAGRYLLHTLQNLACIVRSADPSALRGRFAGVPVIVAAAGPSLDRQLPALRRLAGRALLIAADTAWRPLAAAGIDPHIVVAVDPTDMNGRHLLRVPARRRPWLLAEPSIDPRVPPAFDARFATFRVANHHPWPWLETLGIARPLVRVWGSVVTAACDLALAFGGDPILFVASDLAFTHDQPYCRGTTFEEDWARSAAHGVSLRQTWDATLAAKTLLTLPDLRGTPTRTAPHLVEFRDWLAARSIEHADRRFINTTGAGILAGPRIDQLDLDAALGAYPERDDALRALLHATLAGSTRPALSDTERRAIAAIEQDAASTPRDRLTSPLPDWLDFGRPSLTLPDVQAALRAGRRALDESPRPSKDAHVPVADDAGLDDASQAAIPLRLPVADRVAQMRARLAGDATVLAGSSVSAVRDQVTPAMRAARVQQAFKRLLAIDSPLIATSPDDAIQDGANTASGAATISGGGGAYLAGMEHDATVPLSCRFAWTPDAAPLIGAVEEAMLDIPPRRQPDAAFWTGPIPTTRDADEKPPASPDESAAATAGAAAGSRRTHRLQTPDADRAAEIDPPGARRDAQSGGGDAGEPVSAISAETVMHITLARTALDLRDSLAHHTTRRDARVLDVIARGLEDAGAQPQPPSRSRLAARLRLRDWHAPLPLRIDAFMRALTGTLVSLSGHALAADAPREPHVIEVANRDDGAAPAGDPRVIFLRDDVVFVEPEILSERGLAPGVSCATIDDVWACVSPFGSKHSVRVRADGQFEPHLAWAHEITGEVPWGTDGGALAWHRQSSLLGLRPARSGHAIVTSVPFHPFRVAVGPGGTAYWLAEHGGLWEWTPGQPGRLLTDTPICGGFEIDGEDFILYPLERNADDHLVVPRRFGHAWRYDTAARTLHRIPVAPEAQLSALSVSEGWTARTATFADRISVTHRDGRSAALACHAPLGVAWAGPSLLVTTMHAEMLLFRNLRSYLPPAR